MLGEVQPINYGQPVDYTQHYQLQGQIQTAMQQKYDVNTAKLDAIIEQISNVPIQQEAGKRYLQERVANVLNSVSANLKVSGGNAMLSNSYTNGITSDIKLAIDDKVKKHIKYSQDIVNFQQGVSKLREKDPKLYNQANYEFAMYNAGLENYLKGDVDADLGSLQYVPYKDTWGDATKKALDLQKLKGDQVVEYIDGKGIKQTTTIKGMTPDEIIKYIPGILDSQDEQQIMIDGWYDLKTVPDGGKSRFREHTTRKIETLNDEIKILSAKTEENSTKEEVDRAKSLISDYTSQIEDIKKAQSNIDNMKPEQIGYILKKDQLKSLMADAFSANKSVTTGVDEVWKMKEEFKNDERDYQLKLDELALKKQELNLKAQEKGQKLDANGNLVADYASGVDTTPISDQEYEDLSPENIYDRFVQERNIAVNNITTTSLSIFKDLDPSTDKKQRDAYIANMKVNGFEYDAKLGDFKQVKGKVSKADAMKVAFEKSGLSDVYVEEYLTIVENNDTRLRVGKALFDADKEMQKEKVSKVDTSNQQPFYVTQGGEVHYNTPKNINGVSVEFAKKAGTYLQKNFDTKVKSIYQKNAMLVSNPSMVQAIKNGVDPEVLKAEGIDIKEGSSVKVTYEPSSKKYYIFQHVGAGTKEGESYAKTTGKIEVNPESTLGKNISNWFSEKEKTYDTRDFQKGKVFTSDKNNLVLKSGDDKIKGDIISRMSKVIKSDDSTLTNMNVFLVDSIIKDRFTSKLVEIGYDEQASVALSNSLVSKLKHNLIRPNIEPGERGWFSSIVDSKGEKLLRKQIGNGTSLNKDAINASRLYPGQYVASMLYENLDKLDKETIENILK